MTHHRHQPRSSQYPCHHFSVWRPTTYLQTCTGHRGGRLRMRAEAHLCVMHMGAWHLCMCVPPHAWSQCPTSPQIAAPTLTCACNNRQRTCCRRATRRMASDPVGRGRIISGAVACNAANTHALSASRGGSGWPHLMHCAPPAAISPGGGHFVQKPSRNIRRCSVLRFTSAHGILQLVASGNGGWGGMYGRRTCVRTLPAPCWALVFKRGR